MKVSIIGGGGLVGSCAGFALQAGKIVREIVLVDVNQELCEGQALDLLHGAALTADQKIYAAPTQACADSDVIVITAGLRRKPDESRLDLINRNVALFRGDLKLVKNSPPVGDGQWHLYDIGKDPGETRDLQTALPQLFATMQQDYLAYEKAHGVLPMPEGYNPVKAVFINGVYNYWLPTYGPTGVVLLVLLASIALLWKRKRRAQHP